MACRMRAAAHACARPPLHAIARGTEFAWVSRVALPQSSAYARKAPIMDFNIGMALWLWILVAPIVGALIFSGR